MSSICGDFSKRCTEAEKWNADTGDVADDGSDAGDDESSYDTGDGDTSQYDETDSYAGTEEGDMDEE